MVLIGAPLVQLTSAELASVLVDRDFPAAAGDAEQDYEAGILGELADRAKRGDPIAARTVARYEDGDHIVCACGQMHERDYCPTSAGHGVVL